MLLVDTSTTWSTQLESSGLLLTTRIGTLITTITENRLPWVRSTMIDFTVQEWLLASVTVILLGPCPYFPVYSSPTNSVLLQEWYEILKLKWQVYLMLTDLPTPTINYETIWIVGFRAIWFIYVFIANQLLTVNATYQLVASVLQ